MTGEDRDTDVGTMSQEAFESVWDALEDTPEAAANMRLRADLMIAVEQEVQG